MVGFERSIEQLILPRILNARTVQPRDPGIPEIAYLAIEYV
jgi:hypothetical protein